MKRYNDLNLNRRKPIKKILWKNDFFLWNPNVEKEKTEEKNNKKKYINYRFFFGAHFSVYISRLLIFRSLIPHSEFLSRFFLYFSVLLRYSLFCSCMCSVCVCVFSFRRRKNTYFGCVSARFRPCIYMHFDSIDAIECLFAL